MQLLEIAYFVVIASALVHVRGQDSLEIDFESNLTSWRRLRIDAGYLSESGIYRGGMWRRARTEENEYYQCTQNRTNYCQNWSLWERSRSSAEEGRCFCEQGGSNYCAQWRCPHEEIECSCNRRRCRNVIERQTTDCVCDETDANEVYCTSWSCIERGECDCLEHEQYTCLHADVSGQYCFRWKGEIYSSIEVESAICECVVGAESYCDYWECKERGIMRCSAHPDMWCDLRIAIGAGGALGLVFTLVGFCIGLDSDSNSEFRYSLLFGIFACLMLTVGVVIWGGIVALASVLAIWVPGWILAYCVLAWRGRQIRESKTVHPYAQDFTLSPSQQRPASVRIVL